MTCLIDASVAAKWFLAEEGSDRAAALATSDETLWAPALIVAEITNLLWRAGRAGRVPPDALDAAVQRLPRFFDRLLPDADLAPRALAIAVALDHPAYDCFYLAAAVSHELRLVTADGCLCGRVQGTEFETYVQQL